MQGINRAALRATAALLAPAAAAAADPGKPPLTAQTATTGGPLDPDQQKLIFDTADLAFEIFPEREAIAGVATLGFTAKAPLSRLVIDLDRNLPVRAIAIDGVALPRGAWRNPQGRMTIDLPQEVAAGGKISARISYGGIPHVAARAPWDGGFIWAKTPSGKPWVATAIQGEGCDLFWPCIDYPTFEPRRIDLHITVPAGLGAPSNGVLTGIDALPDGRSRWNWRVTNPTIHSVALNVGPYRELKTVHTSFFGNKIPMHFWYLEGNDAKARKLFAEFAPMLDFYEATIGPYPFAAEKMGVVETPHLGMEHQTINAYGNGYKQAPEGFDWLLHHEFGHEWFANQMTVANWDDFWLHEAHTQYMQPLYGRARDGEARYLAMMREGRARIANLHPIVSGSPRAANLVGDDKTGPGSDIYFKGAWMLHTLRGLIGEDPFAEILRRTVYGRPDPAPGNFTSRFSTTAEYRQIANQVAGRDLGWFFDAYLGQAALPELIETRRRDRVLLAWKVPGGGAFPLPVEVSVDGLLQTLPMTDGRGSVPARTGAKVIVDPQMRVLRKLPGDGG